MAQPGEPGRKEACMPRKRSVEVRLREAEEKADRIKLEKTIKDLKEKMPRRKRR